MAQSWSKGLQVFTGIVSDVGSVAAVEQRNDVSRLRIRCAYEPAGIAIGASIACAGVCMTVVACGAGDGGGAVIEVDAAPETLRLTTVGAWREGTRVNLERSLKLGDELGGHLMAGHVDAVARIGSRQDMGDAVRFGFVTPDGFSRFIAPKGSVALDGTSLTINRVDGDMFDCLIVPHTLDVTTWRDRRPGDVVNLEVDTIARYVARLVAADHMIDGGANP